MADAKNALLILAGGRSAPDILALLYLKPERVAVLTSNEGWPRQKAFKDMVESLPGTEWLLPIESADAYDLEASKKACNKVLDEAGSGWNWTFAIGSSPKVTGIAAYEIAKERGIPCWHIDTQHEKVVSLAKEIQVDKKTFFHLTLDQYLKAQGRPYKLISGPHSTYREVAEGWHDIARSLATPPYAGDARNILSHFYHAYKQPGVKTSHEMKIENNLNQSGLLQFLQEKKLLNIQKEDQEETICAFASEDSARFLGTGDWLEVYVWHEVKKWYEPDEAIPQAANFKDYCQWGLDIDGAVHNELDLALMYKAQFVLAECKAEQDPFKGQKKHLDILSNKAKRLGGDYVTKLFITNQLRENNDKSDKYASFKKRAHDDNIVVITGEDLPDIGKIIQKEVKHPTYPRT